MERAWWATAQSILVPLQMAVVSSRSCGHPSMSQSWDTVKLAVTHSPFDSDSTEADVPVRQLIQRAGARRGAAGRDLRQASLLQR